MGYSGTEIDETFKGQENRSNNIYNIYKTQVEKRLSTGYN